MIKIRDNARRQGAVADDRNRVAVGSAEQVVADLQAEPGRGGAAGVAGHEQVERALFRVGIAHQPVKDREIVALEECCVK